jgi:aflatoxin B1 aldehyde reductase
LGDKPEATTGRRFDPSTGLGALTHRRYYQEAEFDALEILLPVARKHGLTEIDGALRLLSRHSRVKDENEDTLVTVSSSTKQIREMWRL